ncbi:hypothetical protein LPJ66_004892 [Kickxella alabastrina]|uniref:Uncharacterized protein n=1 Tax=Kickxella alabastrina TaxID=61397 RepID=A0ACC1IG92_9FUNG|nr:hypothetical protein LPJ66_004892 [Kickxella alabastrina]
MDKSRQLLPGPLGEKRHQHRQGQLQPCQSASVKRYLGSLLTAVSIGAVTAWAIFSLWPLLTGKFSRGDGGGEYSQSSVAISPEQQHAHVLPTALTKGEKVLVELFVMSRCPDAVKVEDVFSQVIPAVYPIIDVQLNFIAALDPNATYGAQCKHGDEECLGNIEELCALHHRPDLMSFWRFLMCLNSRFEGIGKDSDLALKCASSAGLDTAAFLACTVQSEGRALFKQSVENSLFARVNTSATVYINGKLRCVEDNGWRDCQGGHRPGDFIRDICAAYKNSGPRPSICGQYPPTTRARLFM